MNTSSLTVSSPAFEDNTPIPAKYTCQGENINPPLSIENIPRESKSLVLIVDDPDAPGGNFDHWIVWNIVPSSTIAENAIPGTEGKNDYAVNHYKGPCPPSGTHRYFFKCYALDTMLDIKPGSNKKDVENAMQQHILASGKIIGLYKKS
jgi:Raf kinase inhibitor-like YbhB/YbcL family protein